MVDFVIANATTIEGGPQFATRNLGGINFPIGKVAFGDGATATEVGLANPLPIALKSTNPSVFNNNKITVGGTPQFVTNLLGAPPNGYELVNCDPITWLFLSESTSGWTNGVLIPSTTQFSPGAAGWVPVPPFGSYYSPIGYDPNPLRGIAIYSPLTNHFFCWKSW